MERVGLLFALIGCAPRAASRGGPASPEGDPTPTISPADPVTGSALPDRTVWPIREDVPWDLPVRLDPIASADVVIVGGGPAGLAAAADALEAGASVMLIEQKAQLGGSLRYGVSLFMFSGTAHQVAAGVEDSPTQLLSEWEGFTGGDPTDPWVMAFAERNVEDVYDWLIGRGVTFGAAMSWDESGGDTPRLHRLSVSGVDLASLLAEGLPDEDLLMSTAAIGLVRDGDGRYSGVVVRDDNDQVMGWVEGGALVVATGGFLRDLERVYWAAPELDGGTAAFASGNHADGNGHDLLEAAGAAWDNPGAVGVYAHGIPDPESPGEELSFSPIKKTLYVNRSGARFTNEVQYNSFFTGQDLVAQDGQLAWAVMDAKIYEEVAVSDPMRLPTEDGTAADEDALLAGGVLYTADTLEELAEDIGVNVSTLTAEVGAYNAAAGLGTVDPWRGVPVDTPPLETAPYYALKVVPALAKAFGGIDVDLNGRVLDGDGGPIPGLYAAGELTGMAGGSLVGDTGFTGSLSAVILSGRIAGAAAAAEALAACDD